MAREFLKAVRDRLFARLTVMRLRWSGAQVGAALRVRGNIPYLLNEGRVRIGDRVRLRNEPARIRFRTTTRGCISLGDDVSLNAGVSLFSDASIEVGSASRIGDNCTIFDTNFHAVHEGQKCRPRPVRIGRNVWLGRNVTVLPGVTIGDHSVIAAGAVVFASVPEREVWRGNPAEFVKAVQAGDGFVRQ
ncbi:MAG: acyltransferase [Sphingobium sp.]